VLVAVALRAISDLLTRYAPLPRALGLPMAILLIALVIGAAGWLIGETLAVQTAELTSALPVAVGKLHEWLAETAPGRAVLDSLGSVDGMASAVKLLGVAVTTIGALVNVLLILALGIYLAADPGLYRGGFLALMPDAARKAIDKALGEAGRDLRRWLGGQLVAMGAVGVFTYFGLLAIDVPFALSLATIAALLEFIPFVGPILSVVPALLIAFTEGPTTAVYVALLYLGVQQLEGSVLMPLVQRWAVALPPALGVLAVVIFGVLLGLPGAVFAVPMMVVTLALVRELYLEGRPSRS
jgi:predicted PurR-regulated permease PerM